MCQNYVLGMMTAKSCLFQLVEVHVTQGSMLWAESVCQNCVLGRCANFVFQS